MRINIVHRPSKLIALATNISGYILYKELSIFRISKFIETQDIAEPSIINCYFQRENTLILYILYIFFTENNYI